MKNIIHTFLFVCILLIASVATIYSQTVTISVNSFGLQPNSRINAVPYVKQAIQECKKHPGAILKFDKGRYDFWEAHCTERDYHESNTYDHNPKILAILLEELEGITIDGSGSEFIMHGRMQPITLHRCKNVTLRNFSIDWEIPLTAQGKVINTTSEYMDIEIDSQQYPYIIENNQLTFVGEGWKSVCWSIMQFDPENHFVLPNSGDNLGWGKIYHATEIKKGIVRLSDPKKETNIYFPAPGTLLVLRHNDRDHAGIFVYHSEQVHMENLYVHHTGGLGILFQYSKELSLNKVHVIPNAKKNRIFSGHDDGFHFMGCSGSIKVDSCSFAGLMDDPINVHGTYARITKILSPTRIQCRFMQNMSEGMEWGRTGEKIGLIENTTMRTVGTGSISKFEALNKTDFIIELTDTLPTDIEIGYALENLSCTPNVEIRNCHFGSCRARGLLVSTPGKVIIENNIFESSGSAILIAGDANDWFESGAVKDILIRGNEFRYPCNSSLYQFCEAVISIYPEIPKPNIDYPYHRNIRIENNTFYLFDYPILYARSVDGLTFSGNRLIRDYHYTPYHYRKVGITLEACKHVLISKTTTEGEVLGHNIEIKEMPSSNVKLKNEKFFKKIR